VGETPPPFPGNVSITTRAWGSQTPPPSASNPSESDPARRACGPTPRPKGN
jgi:hypothetical protein